MKSDIDITYAGSKPGKTSADTKAKKPASVVPAVQRAASILTLLESYPQRRFSLADIAGRLKLPKSSAFNICNELVECRLLRRSPEGYQLGRKLVQLGSAYISSVDLVREFYEACRNLPESLAALAQMAVLDSDLNAVFLARQDCNSGLHLGLRAEIGRRVPATCTASGKAMLAALSPADLELRISGLHSFPRLTAKSILGPTELRKEVENIRKRGYAIDDEEVLQGVYCVAMAARMPHRDDRLLAISLTSNKARIDSTRRRELVEMTDRLVDNLQSRL
ncbi:IclR family transcriptional regulator [Brucella intermedia]|uniref:IclR family transcriptional regulator n=1 Tax=Brucella intermedia TaxID=94625 RepID=UPI00224A9109|nr:IclR family transcriptional regulator [Brucella intermedia]